MSQTRIIIFRRWSGQSTKQTQPRQAHRSRTPRGTPCLHTVPRSPARRRQHPMGPREAAHRHPKAAPGSAAAVAEPARRKLADAPRAQRPGTTARTRFFADGAWGTGVVIRSLETSCSRGMKVDARGVRAMRAELRCSVQLTGLCPQLPRALLPCNTTLDTWHCCCLSDHATPGKREQLHESPKASHIRLQCRRVPCRVFARQAPPPNLHSTPGCDSRVQCGRGGGPRKKSSATNMTKTSQK